MAPQHRDKKSYNGMMKPGSDFPSKPNPKLSSSSSANRPNVQSIRNTNSSNSSTKNSNNNNELKSDAKPTDEGAISKQLTGATMNMKFMKKIQKTKDARVERLAARDDEARRNGEWVGKVDEKTNSNVPSADNDKTTHAPAAGVQNAIPKKTAAAAAATTRQQSTTTPKTLSDLTITLATPSDMHGISSKIIQRRSYNLFNSYVESTYTRRLGDIDEVKRYEKLEKSAIGDEEMSRVMGAKITKMATASGERKRGRG